MRATSSCSTLLLWTHDSRRLRLPSTPTTRPSSPFRWLVATPSTVTCAKYLHQPLQLHKPGQMATTASRSSHWTFGKLSQHLPPSCSPLNIVYVAARRKIREPIKHPGDNREALAFCDMVPWWRIRKRCRCYLPHRLAADSDSTADGDSSFRCTSTNGKPAHCRMADSTSVLTAGDRVGGLIDLAAFFRVWLHQFLPDEAMWQYALGGSAVEATTNGSGADYTAVLSGIFQECKRVLKDNGRFIFTFHHWNPKGWAALTIALQRAGFSLVTRYVVHSENLASRHIVGQNALVHDVILVCAPADEGMGGDWDEVTAVTLTDSTQFCYDCGSILGWLLHSEASEAEIEATWQKLLDQRLKNKD